MKRPNPGPLQDMRHRLPLRNKERVMTRILCNPEAVPKLIRKALYMDIYRELSDPFGFGEVGSAQI